jgi:LPXTG-motif cell wall-anchored protein
VTLRWTGAGEGASKQTIADANLNGAKVEVYFDATLNSNAKLGKEGNINGAKLAYSNTPDSADDHEEEELPWDYVIAFTYKLDVNKVDDKGAALNGAEFKLEKVINGAANKELKLNVAGNVFSATGLDDGNYRLTETDTPDGYNSIDPIEFTVTADHEIEWTDEGARLTVLETLTGDVTTGQISFTATEDKSTLDTTVINEQGVILPETGGVGTTIFYILGGLLSVCAIVLLITKKRMSFAF